MGVDRGLPDIREEQDTTVATLMPPTVKAELVFQPRAEAKNHLLLRPNLANLPASQLPPSAHLFLSLPLPSLPPLSCLV